MSLDIYTNMNSLYAQSYLSPYALQSYNSTQNQDLGFATLGDLVVSQTAQQETAIYAQDVNNASQGVSLVQTATTGLEATQNILQQMSALATESASGVYTSTQLGDLQTEYSQLQSEVNNIANTTVFNGTSLLQNPSGSLSIQVGGTSSTTGTVTVNLPQADTTSLGIASTDISTASNATSAISSLTNATNNINNDLSQLGSTQIILQNASKQDMGIVTNLAAENSYLTTNNNALTTETNSILNQADALILGQANGTSAYALQLLPGYQNSSPIYPGSLINMLV